MAGPEQAATWRPPHAHVPGVNQRHPEDLFDFLKEGVSSCALNDLPDSNTWQHATAFLHDGYFWEAHELFECIWMACPPNSPEKLYVQSLIQRANAALKQKTGQYKASQKIEHHAKALHTEAVRRSASVLFGRAVDAL